MTTFSCEGEQKEEILKPGFKIRPNVTLQIVENLGKRLYGIVTKEIRELPSYDDKNFLIFQDKNIKNPLITKNWENGYILKILNSHDSKKNLYVDAQTKLMIFLRHHKIICPNPIKNVYGEYFSLESIGNTENIIRLLEFQPGRILHEVHLTDNLLHQVGQFVGKLNNATKDFTHEGLQNHKSIWMLQSIPNLRHFLYVIKDIAKKKIVEDVIHLFEKKVVSIMHSLKRGVIHGDLNEQNIIVDQSSHRYEFYIAGIIDFGDISISPYIFELAIALTYAILQSKSISAGGLVILGYLSEREISDQEKEILKYCVAGRLCQSLVLGCYTHEQDPENDYLLTTQKSGWEVLENMWTHNLERIDQIWYTAADNYKKRNSN